MIPPTMTVLDPSILQRISTLPEVDDLPVKRSVSLAKITRTARLPAAVFSPSMESVEQVTITMPNIPSSLAKVGDKLRSSNVNIEAISCTEGPSSTAIHLIVDDPDTAKLVLKELGHVSSNGVLALKMRNTPGGIANIGRACAAVDVNIHTIYATTCGREAMVYVSVENVEDAMERLTKWQKSSGKLD